MKNGVRKLLFEAVLVQELFDPPRDYRLLQDLVNIRPAMNIHGKHLRHQGLELPTKMCRERRIFPANNFQSQKVKVHPLEGRLQGAQLIQHHPERPDITLERVGTALYNLWGQVVRGAHHAFGHFYSVFQHACYAEVSQFDDVRFRQEHILALDVTMQDLPIVHVL